MYRRGTTERINTACVKYSLHLLLAFIDILYIWCIGVRINVCNYLFHLIVQKGQNCKNKYMKHI